MAEGKSGNPAWVKGVSGNPAGKPKGAKNVTTAAAEALLDGEAETLTRRCVELALEGDSVAMRLCIERILPLRKGRPVTIDLPEVTTAAGVTAALSVVVLAMAAGRISPDEASSIAGVLENQRRSLELTELASRVAELEQRAGVRPPIELDGTSEKDSRW